MKLLQAVVFLAVIFANIHWEITPNAYLAAAVGGMAAYGATMFVVWLQDTGSRLKSRRRRRQERVYQGPLPPALPR